MERESQRGLKRHCVHEAGKACAPGTFSDVAAAATSLVCTACVAGRYYDLYAATSSLGCTACTAGQYNSLIGASGCTVCAPGSFSPGTPYFISLAGGVSRGSADGVGTNANFDYA